METIFTQGMVINDLDMLTKLYILLFLFPARMGRGFIVEDAVEGYLSNLCEQPSPTTGLLIGQVQYKCSFH